MSQKRVGVFMKAYRNELTIHEAIKTVLNQTYQNIRFYILVNKETKPVLKKYLKEDERVKLMEGGLNDGFRTYATYVAKENDYVTVIDADDMYVNTYVEELLNIAEKNSLDMVACGSYFFVENGKIIGERRIPTVFWKTKDTCNLLPHIYGHFRTIWGKLIASEVILRCDFSELPNPKTYGGYGGDTLLMFHLFLSTKKLCVVDKTLYFYRVSETSTTHNLTIGRLDSDEILYYRIENILRKIGTISDETKRFLFLIYGNALLDTINLLYKTEMYQKERVEKFLYIFRKPLTEELFLRENLGMLKVSKIVNNKKFSNEVYQVLFKDIEVCKSSQRIMEQYLQLLKIIFPKLKNILKLEEFQIVLKNKEFLNCLVKEQYSQLIDLFLNMFEKFSETEIQNVVSLMRKLESNTLLKYTFQNVEFIKGYIELIKCLNSAQYEKMLVLLKKYFSEDVPPFMAEHLVELWLNLAAVLQNEAEFILAEQIKVETLLLGGKLEDAASEYEELVKMGIDDNNMKYLESCFKK